MRILIAEDDRVTAALLTRLLETRGYEVVTVENGQDAIRTFLRDPAVHVVLLDWMLPGIDGPEVCRRLREAAGDRCLYVVMVTSRHEQADVIEGLQAGVDDYLAKPFDASALNARVAKAIEAVEQCQRLKRPAPGSAPLTP